jgi:hypothetical protein
MNKYCKTVPLLIAISVLSGAHATDSIAPSMPATMANKTAMGGLNPAQLSAIRGISRNVLAAKKGTVDDGADAAQLASLRTSLDKLIEMDLDTSNRLPITLQSQETIAQGKTSSKFASLRTAAIVDLRAIATQIRSRGELHAARAHGDAKAAQPIVGMHRGANRSRLFERWADKIDAALAADGVERTSKLRLLREQLHTTNRLSDVPITHGTPTLQAMPAGFIAPKMSPSNDGAAKK